MQCPKCAKTLVENVVECVHCGIIVEKYLKRQQGAATGVELKTERPMPGAYVGPEGIVGEAAVVDSGPPTLVQKFRWPVLILGALAFIFWKTRPQYLPPQELLAAGVADELSSDPCLAKDRCVVVYIAPWCGACKASLPGIKGARDYANSTETFGFKIVIGNDQPQKLQDMATEIGANTFLDGDGTYGKKLKISHFPTWMVFDRNRKLLEVDRGAMDWVNTQVAAK